MTTADGRVEVAIVRNLGALASLADEWQQLAANALEANVFYEPAALVPAIERFVGEGAWRVVVIRLDERLIGVVPLQDLTLRGYRTRIVQQLMRHEQSFLHTPLVDRRHASTAIRAWLKWCARPGGGRLILCPRMRLDGPVAALLRQEIAAIGGRCSEHGRFERPLFVPGENADAYLKRSVRHHRRRQVRKQRERLKEMGPLAYTWLDEGADVAEWTSDFVQLEASGWKGRDGGAIGSVPTRHEYFRQLIENHGRRGRVTLTKLTLDQRPIAMSAILCSAEGGEWFCYKSAYDEQLRSLGPGVILEVEFVLRAHEDARRCVWVDSCTSPGKHQIVAELWSDTVAIGQLELAMPGLLGRVSSKVYGYVRRNRRAPANAVAGSKD